MSTNSKGERTFYNIMGNFMSAVKSTDTSDLRQPSRSGTTAAIRSSFKRSDSKASYLFGNPKRRIGDNHSNKSKEDAQKSYHSRPPVTTKTNSVLVDEAEHDTSLQKPATSTTPTDSKMKRVMIQDDNLKEDSDGKPKERAFYRQGTPHPTRKRMSIKSNVLDVIEDNNRKQEVAEANKRFNEGNQVCDKSIVDSDATPKDFPLEKELDTLFQIESQLPLENELDDAIFQIESQPQEDSPMIVPMSVDFASDIALLNEHVIEVKDNTQVEEPEKKKEEPHKKNRLMRTRQKESGPEYSPITDVEMHEDCIVPCNTSMYFNTNPLPEMVKRIEQVSQTGQCEARTTPSRRKASTVSPSSTDNPKRQRRISRPKEATPAQAKRERRRTRVPKRLVP